MPNFNKLRSSYTHGTLIGYVYSCVFNDEDTEILVYMGKPTFKDGRKFTFTKITIEGEFRGSINKGFEVSSDGNIAKVGFIYAKITSKEVVETSLNPDNALDKVLLQWNVEEDMIEELLRRVK